MIRKQNLTHAQTKWARYACEIIKYGFCVNQNAVRTIKKKT